MERDAWKIRTIANGKHNITSFINERLVSMKKRNTQVKKANSPTPQMDHLEADMRLEGGSFFPRFPYMNFGPESDQPDLDERQFTAARIPRRYDSWVS